MINNIIIRHFPTKSRRFQVLRRGKKKNEHSLTTAVDTNILPWAYTAGPEGADRQ